MLVKTTNSEGTMTQQTPQEQHTVQKLTTHIIIILVIPVDKFSLEDIDGSSSVPVFTVV